MLSKLVFIFQIVLDAANLSGIALLRNRCFYRLQMFCFAINLLTKKNATERSLVVIRN